MDKGKSNSQFSKSRKSTTNIAAIKEIDYKDVNLLRQFVTERGKLLPRRITGLSQKQQIMLTKAVKRARCIALMPFVATEN